MADVGSSAEAEAVPSSFLIFLKGKKTMRKPFNPET